MGIILTNWKAALSRLGFWRIAVLIGWPIFVVATAAGLRGDVSLFARIIMHPWLLIPLLWVAQGMDQLLQEGSCKPFSFCLPGYRETLRKLSFRAAALFGLVFAWVFLAPLWRPGRSDYTLLEALLRGTGGFCVGAAAALSISSVRFVLAWGIIRLLSLILFFGGMFFIIGSLEYTVMLLPLTGASLVFGGFMWHLFGDMDRLKARQRARIEYAMEELTQVGWKTTSAWIERLFLGCMKRFRGRVYLWGGLYRILGEIISYWLWILAPIVLGALVLGYANKLVAELLFIALPAIVVFGIDLPVTSDMLLPEGRDEKYRASIAAVVGTSLFLAAIAFVTIVFSQLFSIFMPDIWGCRCVGIPFEYVYLPCLLVPGFLALHLVTLKARIIAVVDVCLVAILVGGVALYIRLGDYTWPEYTRPVLFSSVFVCGWIAFLLTSRRVCSKWYLGK